MRIFRRLSIMYDLRNLKIIKMAKAKERLRQQYEKQQEQEEEENQMNDVYPDFVMEKPQKIVKSTKPDGNRMETFVNFLRQIFNVNQIRFLFVLMKSDTKENDISRRFLLFWMGISYTLLYFYIQVYVFEKFQTLTLLLVTVMAITTIILPQFSRWAQSFSLILMPRSVMIVLRGAILSVIAFQIHTVTRFNIERNYKILVTSIQCNVRKTERFASQSKSFGFGDTRGQKSFRFNFVNPFKPFVESVKSYALSISEFFQRTQAYLDKVNAVGNWIADKFTWLPSIDFGITGFLVDNIAKPLGNQVNQITDNIGKQILSWFEIKFHSNYHFYWKSSQPNQTIGSVIADSLNEVVERHSYIQYVMSFVEQLVHFYVFTVFILIFFPPLLYIYKFRRRPSFDNFYITDKLIAYDEEMVASGGTGVGLESIFPLRFVELFMYVRRTDPILTIQELQSALMSFIVDFLLLSYVLTFMLVDFIMVHVVVQFAKIYEFVYELALPEQFPKFLQILNTSSDASSPMKNLIDADTFVQDYQVFRQDIRQCLPIVSDIDWAPYRKCLTYFGLLMLWKTIRPYINRTRSVVCTNLYPKLAQSRVVYLYNHIWFQRMIMDVYVSVLY
ncbi:uncharacterized protein LOC124498628 isoform X2 [Dermatophagoides farinae]|uniref:uncharacterized protein LOC124498628 isoform X2 n=1 Tax=Dermatophagoides farinae TaxID=6954 RepID=UPI003F64628F